MTAPLPPEQETAPTCYRHPDRETWVRCTRCERPICPDCMIPASVGFQCPDDVREASKGVRQPRTAFGGRLTDDVARVSLLLVVANVTVFVVGMAVGQQQVIGRYGDVPVLVAQGETYRLLTSTFVHAGLLHLLFNMMALASIGPGLEQALGRVRYVALYALSALGGSVASYWLSDPVQVGVGASGAIFGLFGAWFVVARRLGGDTRGIVTILAINIVIGFVVPQIDWRAHLGGLATGAVVAAVLAYAPRQRREALQAAGCAAVAALLVALVVLRTSVLREDLLTVPVGLLLG